MRRLVLLTLTLTACGRTPPPEPMGAPDRPQVALHGVRMRMYRGSDLVMQGRAARIAFNRQTSAVSAEEALMQFRPSPPDGPRRVELRAPRLEGLLTTRQADLSGGVLLRSQAGLQGETERVHFDGSQMVARGDRPVRLRGPDSALAADGFTLDFLQEAYAFEGQVVTEVDRRPR